MLDFEEVKNRIKKSNIKGAIQLLNSEETLKNNKNLSRIIARYNNLEKQKIKGVISSENLILQSNQIIDSLLEFIESKEKVNRKPDVSLTYIIPLIIIVLFLNYHNILVGFFMSNKYQRINQKVSFDIGLIDSSKIKMREYFLEYDLGKQELNEVYEDILKYNYEENNDQIKIIPEVEYYQACISEKKKPLDFYNEPYIFFPELDIKFINNSSEKIFITKAFIDVISSEIIEIPIPALYFSHSPCLNIGNEGLGEMLNTQIVFNIVSINDNYSFDDNFLFKKELEFNSRNYYCLKKELDQLGVDTTILYDCEFSDIYMDLLNGFHKDSIYKDELTLNDYFNKTTYGKLGVFQGVQLEDLENVRVYGQINYEYLLEDEVKSNKLDFNIVIPFFTWCGLGDGGPVVSSKYKVELEVNKDNYQIYVPVSQLINGEDVDRFVLNLFAKKSSKHLLRLRLVYNEGKELISKPVHLELFVDKSFAQLEDWL